MRHTALDRQWEALMALCREEATLTKESRHPKLAQFLGHQIERLALELGFDDRQIQRREFRAEKNNGHVVRILLD